MAKKLKRGRPRLSARSETVSVTFETTKAKKKAMTAKAKAAGMKLSAWIRGKCDE